MSSVPKSRRLTTDVKFITELRELKKITIQKCIKLPKRYNATITDQLIKSVSAAKHAAMQANAIIPTCGMEFTTRRKHFLEACSELEALAGDVDDLMEMRDIFNISFDDLEAWTKQIDSSLFLILRVMASDEKRFQKLPLS